MKKGNPYHYAAPQMRSLKTEKSEKVEESTQLTDLKGLGKAWNEKLQSVGITQIEQLANLTTEQLQVLEEKLPGFVQQYEKNDWGGQAAKLV